MSDEEDLYDEFGNYIGPDLESSDEDADDDEDEDKDHGDDHNPKAPIPDDASDVSYDGDRHQTAVVVVREDEEETANPMSAVVLHEDKEHYQSAEQVYGEDVRTAVLDEDAMEIDTPLVEPVKNKSDRAHDSVASEDWIYTEDYLTTVLLSNDTTRTRRGVALVGHMHHGKTSLIDFLLELTLRKSWGPKASLDVNQGGGPRYTDIHKSEQERQMSLVSTPITTLLPDTRGKTYCFTMVDCPGHPNFHDETVAALRIADGAVVVVDAVEGIMMHTEMAVRQAIAEGLPIVLVITKIDRLIVEVKLPPRDTYFKLLYLVEEMNDLIQEVSMKRYPKLAPEMGNVGFASAQHGFFFTLHSFATTYLDHGNNHGLGDNLSVEAFAHRLWGDCYLDPSTRRFHKAPRDCASNNVERTFVTYILEPLYKLYSACLGGREKDVSGLLRSVGVLLSKDELRASGRPLLRSALSQFLRTSSCGFVDMIAKHM
jgi:116 kDa U5 small nuclear ribonucleoprotein component